MSNIVERLSGDLREYAPVPFWSWNNRLEEGELLKQIAEMQSVGCGGFVLHARTGLKAEYLSDEWFSLVGSCLNEAKKRGMHVWIYDENGWPSGFAGGKLLTKQENLAQYLVLEESETFNEEALAVFVLDVNGFRRVMQPEEGESYYNVIRKYSPSNTDILNPAVVEQFIACTHKQYYKRFRRAFGKELTGFFTDEPQYMRGETPYTPVVNEYFKKHYHEDVLDHIISLFFDSEAHYGFRVRYYTALNRLYTQNYYRRLYDWCNKHKCRLTGHSLEENRFFAQMWGAAGVSPSYEFEHVPAIDNLAPDNPAKLSARQVGSVAAQTGKKQILTETFGCCGYTATPKQLKQIAEKQYVHGVNLMCHHLFAYSLAGQGKVDHPPCFSRHMTWWKQFPRFNEYFTRLGYLLANSTAQVNCAVISPMSGVYLHYNVKDEARARQLDSWFDILQSTLNLHGISYELADEQILAAHGKVKGKTLEVGLRSYSYLIVPDTENLSKSTKKLLKKYVKHGGKILVIRRPRYTDGAVDDWSFLKSNTTFEGIAENGAIQLQTDGKAEYTYRVGENGEFSFLYLVNPEKEPARVTIPAGFSRLNLHTLQLTKSPCEITLAAGEGAVFASESGEKQPQYLPAEEIAPKFSFRSATCNNLTLDTVKLSFDGATFGKPMNAAAAFDELLRKEYCGKVTVAFEFIVNAFGDTLKLRREKGNYLSSALNGVPLTFTQSEFDVMFEEADVKDAVKKGKNVYVAEIDFYERPEVYYALFSPEATESLKNCLAYDTELENVYLIGDFIVNARRQICHFKRPAKLSNLEKQGYPFFAGEVRAAAEIEGKAPRAELTLHGEFCAAEIFVNGTSAGMCFEGEGVEISLNPNKKNKVEVVFSSTLRNMFGPLHWKQEETGGIGPFHFTMRGAWKDGKCEYFTPAYNLRPFGLSSVQIAFAE